MKVRSRTNKKRRFIEFGSEDERRKSEGETELLANVSSTNSMLNKSDISYHLTPYSVI